jgi:hypothetical protein
MQAIMARVGGHGRHFTRGQRAERLLQQDRIGLGVAAKPAGAEPRQLLVGS